MADESNHEVLKWTMGLINSSQKYLTAEQFQSKVTCNGNTLKKKQTWTAESQGGEVIALKSTTGKYLTADRDGKLDCSGEEVGPDQKFKFVTQDSGKVAIQSDTHSRYVGGSGDSMRAFDQSIGDANLFTIQLAIHPQVNIRNVNRKTYIHYNESTDELCCNELIPWGYDATVILEFYDGKYALRAANTKYLSRTGELKEGISPDVLFTLIFRGSQVAFKDNNGKYLTAVGANAVVQSRKSTIGKDELFDLMDSKPQIQLVASNGKFLSIREGIEVRAKQMEPTDKEIFQMEPANNTDFSGNVQWAFRSCNNKFWDSGSGSITSDSPSASSATSLFTVEWKGTKIVLKASNGKYVGIKPNGQMLANCAEIEDKCYFTFKFINRPILIVRGSFGFVGVKGSSGTLECNRSQYDVFLMSEVDGAYTFKGANGKYFKIESDQTLSMNGDHPTVFNLELKALSRMIIMDPNSGKSLKGQQSGSFTATGEGVGPNTLWEY